EQLAIEILERRRLAGWPGAVSAPRARRRGRRRASRRGRRRSNIPKRQDAELRLGHDLDPLDLPQLLGRVRGEVELLLELLAERLDAEELEGQPDAQAAEVARQLGRQLAE